MGSLNLDFIIKFAIFVLEFLKKMSNYLVEICANSAASALEAQRGGAGRVELCAGIPEGGTTPSYGEIEMARQRIDILLNVIIRPRSGDFLYSEDELQIMKRDIQIARELGADGVVFGCLTADGLIDLEACRELVAAAEGLSLTFHRAFDVCREPLVALEQIIELGFDRILTSGCEPSAPMGKELLRELVQRAGDRIIIMPGCGVNASNVEQLKSYTGAREFHLSARHRVESKMEYRNQRVSMGGEVKIEEFSNEITSAQIVAQVVDIVKQ